MKWIAVLILIIPSLVLAEPVRNKGLKYVVPTGYISFETANKLLFQKTKQQMEKGEDGMRVIDGFALLDNSNGKLLASVIIAEEKQVRVSDQEYLTNIAGMFKRNNLGDYQPVDWKQDYYRLDAVNQNLSYFVKTINGRQIVFICNYRTNVLRQQIEQMVSTVLFEKN